MQAAIQYNLAEFLPRKRAESVLCLETVDSTNTFLKDMASEGAVSGQVVIAGEQTGGRGRRGRSFCSPAGKGIYMSYLMRPEGSPSDTVTITAWTAIAVCRAVERVCGVRAGIKWVNDIVLNGKKLCGTLTEAVTDGSSSSLKHVVIGIGINVNTDRCEFPADIADTACSLMSETGRAYDTAELAAAIIEALDTMSFDWPDMREKYLSEYRSRCVTVGKTISVISGDAVRHGMAAAVNGDFSLLVRFEDGTVENVSSGEVSVRGMYGYVE